MVNGVIYMYVCRYILYKTCDYFRIYKYNVTLYVRLSISTRVCPEQSNTLFYVTQSQTVNTLIPPFPPSMTFHFYLECSDTSTKRSSISKQQQQQQQGPQITREEVVYRTYNNSRSIIEKVRSVVRFYIDGVNSGNMFILFPMFLCIGIKYI